MDQINILVTDDEREIADLLEIYLVSDGYRVWKAYSAKEGLQILQEHDIQLAILDIMMPEMDGIEMCRQIRKFSNIPVIFLSAKSADLDKILGLGCGADDYVTKPFSPLELTARVKSQLRRYTEFDPDGVQKKDASEVISIRGVVINRTTHVVTVDGEEIKLTPLEFDILWYLCEHKGNVVSSEELFEAVWKEKYIDSNNTVMTHIARLREKLHEPARKPKYVKTVWGVGYTIDD